MAIDAVVQPTDASKQQALDKILSQKEDAIYLRALLEMDGIGGLTIQRLLNESDSLSALWDASDAFLSTHLSQLKREVFKRRRDEGLHSDWLETYQKIGVTPVPFTSPAYPRLLSEIHDPPLLLYVKGDVSAVQGNTLAVVGTRHATVYGCQATETIIQEMKPYNPILISGLAKGIDTVAHQAAIRCSLPTVAVFGCGLDVVYPSNNRALAEEIVACGGLLISEYPLGTPPTKYTFPQRNRIVAGLSQGVLMVEGDLKSGALITARLGLEEGRSIFAVPGNIFEVGSQGPLHLIRQGALAVACGEDIAKELNWPASDSTTGQQIPFLVTRSESDSKPEVSKSTLCLPLPIPDTLSEVERAVLQSIPLNAVAIEDLQQTSGLPSAKINQCLTMLELEGLIVLLPGAKVCRKQRY